MMSYLASVLRRHTVGSETLRPRWQPFSGDDGGGDRHEEGADLSSKTNHGLPAAAERASAFDQAPPPAAPVGSGRSAPPTMPAPAHDAARSVSTIAIELRQPAGTGSTARSASGLSMVDDRTSIPTDAVRPATAPPGPSEPAVASAAGPAVGGDVQRMAPSAYDEHQASFDIDASLPSTARPSSWNRALAGIGTPGQSPEAHAHEGAAAPGKEQVVRLHIGRIDIHVDPVAPPVERSVARVPQQERPSLEDFMQRRRETLT